jgi:hypothetical protein
MMRMKMIGKVRGWATVVKRGAAVAVVEARAARPVTIVVSGPSIKICAPFTTIRGYTVT